MRKHAICLKSHICVTHLIKKLKCLCAITMRIFLLVLTFFSLVPSSRLVFSFSFHCLCFLVLVWVFGFLLDFEHYFTRVSCFGVFCWLSDPPSLFFTSGWLPPPVAHSHLCHVSWKSPSCISTWSHVKTLSTYNRSVCFCFFRFLWVSQHNFETEVVQKPVWALNKVVRLGTKLIYFLT